MFGNLQFPKGDGPFPAVVFCHGGFAVGNTDVSDMRDLLNAGFAVFVPAWRGENGNPGNFELYLGEAEDAVAAMEYLTTDARIDPENIFLAGHSIGATNAMLAAELSKIPRGAVAIGGMLDMYTFHRKSGERLFEEIPFDWRDQEENRVRSPGQFISDLSCPLQLYYGEDEFPDSVKFAKAAAKRASELGKRIEYIKLDGDDQMLATAERDGDAFLWNLKTGIGFSQHKADGRANIDCALTPDGAYFYLLKGVHPNSRLYGNMQQPEVVEFDTKTLRETRRLPHPGMISLHMSPSGG